MKTVEKSKINSRLLAVRGAVGRAWLPQAEKLSVDLRPEQDFCGRDVVPLLVLLPAGDVADTVVDVAAAMQVAYLAGRVHDLATEQGGELCGHAILVGDYLYAYAAVRLQMAGYDGWLAKMGRALVRRSEARQVAVSWAKRAYVADSERLSNLPREHAEMVSVAAALAARAAGLSGDEAAAYAEFGFHLGILHGIAVYGYARSVVRDEEVARACEGARLALAKLSNVLGLADVAEELLVRPLLEALAVEPVQSAQVLGATLRHPAGHK